MPYLRAAATAFRRRRRQSVGRYAFFIGERRLHGDEPAVVVEPVADFHLRKRPVGMADADFEGLA